MKTSQTEDLCFSQSLRVINHPPGRDDTAALAASRRFTDSSSINFFQRFVSDFSILLLNRLIRRKQNFCYTTLQSLIDFIPRPPLAVPSRAFAMRSRSAVFRRRYQSRLRAVASDVDARTGLDARKNAKSTD